MRVEHWFYTIPLRFRSLLRRKTVDAELDEELRFHLQSQIDLQISAGLSPDEARYAAQRAIGGITQIKEACRDTRKLNWVDDLAQDTRYAARMLRKTPGFTAVAILSLALGIGANSAIFTLINAVLLRQLAVRDPQQLVQLTNTVKGDWNSYFGYPQFEQFRSESRLLSGIFGMTGLGRVNVTFRGRSDLARGEAATDNLFAVLGVTAQYGRLFMPGDDPQASVVVLSDRYWRHHFAGDLSALGETVSLNQIPFTIVGIAPPEFSGISLDNAPDLWAPMHALDRFKLDRTRWREPFTSWLVIAGRMRPGVSRDQAQAELDLIHRRLLTRQLSAVERPGETMQRFVRESHLVLRGAANGLFSGLREHYAFPLLLLMVTAAGVLLIACANLANLLLARASARRREIAVRLGLGAGRGRIVRQLLTESVLLAGIGGLAALRVAWWGSAVLVRMIASGDAAVPLVLQPDWRVFGFTAVVSFATGIVFGVAPAIQEARVNPGLDLKEGVGQAKPATRRTNRLLIAVQVALSIVLVTSAGLFGRTLHNLSSVDMGYERENVLVFSVNAKLAGYPNDRATALYRKLLEKLQAIPNVESISLSRVRPADDEVYLVERVGEVDGHKLTEHDSIRVAFNSIGPGYFLTVKTPILLGREFNLRDDEAAPKVVIVNESLASRVLPGQNPIGHRLGGATIIGVVRDSRYGGPREQPRSVLYHALFQSAVDDGISVEMRQRAGGDALQEARREIASIDRNLAIFRAATLRGQVQTSMLRERLLATLSSFFGVVALFLACVGIYGLMAYSVARRTAEIGVRIALGAQRSDVVWIVLREALILTLAGVAAGVPAALWMARYAKSLLFGVSAADPAVVAGSIAIMAGIAILAGYLPARRASHIDPMTALRYE